MTMLKPFLPKIKAAVAARKAGGLPSLPTPNPPAAPKAAAPLNNRPMGVSPAPMPNPMPMSPAEKRGRMMAATQRGTRPAPMAMAEGGKVRGGGKKSSKGRCK